MKIVIDIDYFAVNVLNMECRRKTMNLTKLFKTQAELDKKIIEEKGLEGQDLLDKKI